MSQQFLSRKEDIGRQISENRVIKLLVIGEAEIGEYPEILVKCLKNGIPVPLKYTRTLQGIKALIEYGKLVCDTELLIYLRHITQTAFSPGIHRGFWPERADIHVKRSLFNKAVKRGSIDSFTITGSPFWEQQIEKIKRVKQAASKLGIGECDSAYDLIRRSIEVKTRATINQETITDDLKMSPIIACGAAVDGYAASFYFDGIVNSPLVCRSRLFGRTPVIKNKAALRAKLESVGTPAQYIQRIV